MTDNEIKKALECCIDCDCTDCPCNTIEGCKDIDYEATLDLINRQKAELDDLKRDDLPRCKDALRRANEMGIALEKENQELNAEIEKLEALNKCYYTSLQQIAKSNHEIKAEAIKEFAERLKFNVTGIPWCEYGPVHREIDNLVKEMVGEDK